MAPGAKVAKTADRKKVMDFTIEHGLPQVQQGHAHREAGQSTANAANLRRGLHLMPPAMRDFLRSCKRKFLSCHRQLKLLKRKEILSASAFLSPLFLHASLIDATGHLLGPQRLVPQCKPVGGIGTVDPRLRKDLPDRLYSAQTGVGRPCHWRIGVTTDADEQGRVGLFSRDRGLSWQRCCRLAFGALAFKGRLSIKANQIA